MKQPTDLGANRTGLGTSPADGARMIEAANEGTPIATQDLERIAALRSPYFADAPPVGAVPPPTTLKGAVKTGVQMLKGDKPTVFVDRLSARLAFERWGVRLYEMLVMKFDAHGSWEGGPSRDDLVQFGTEELRHAQVVRRAIERLGADPTVQTPSADIGGVESLGITQVITDPRATLAESLHALLIAELGDHDDWGLLIRLAESVGYHDMAAEFREALANEGKHIAHVRAWLSSYVLDDAHRDLEPKA